MSAPYGRLVVLHLTIIVGGLAIATTGASSAGGSDPRAAQDRARSSATPGGGDEADGGRGTSTPTREVAEQVTEVGLASPNP